MAFVWIAVAFLTNIIYVENKMIHTINPVSEDIETPSSSNSLEKVIGINDPENEYQDLYKIQRKLIGDHKTKKPCSIVVLSNAQAPNKQSLLRKYRYDGNGILIPSSVKYYVKLPKSDGSAPILIPLNDKAFSPLGGFLRYYKEVPPIPQSW